MPRSGIPRDESHGSASMTSASAHPPLSPARDARAQPPTAAVKQAQSVGDGQSEPLIYQLRRLYAAIAEEPIPDSISALLRRLKS